MKIERTKNAARNILFGLILKVYQIVIPFLMRTAMIYYMGMEYVGLNSLFTSVLSVLNLAELGVGSAMVFSMYKPIADDDSKTICALMKLYRLYYRVIGGVVCVFGLLLTPFVPKLINGDVPNSINVYVLYLMNLSATVLSYWLFAYKNSIINAHQRIDVISRITLITNTVLYTVQFIIIVLFKNYYLYVMAILVIQAINNIITAIVSEKMYPQYKPEGILSKEERKKINQRIKDLFTAKFGNVILNSVDTIIISAFLGLTLLAVYQNYYYILNSIVALVGVFFTSVIAGMGNSLIKESIEKNYNDLKRFTFLINWILCICCCCFISLYQPFMRFWVGEKYLLSYKYVILFVLYFYVCELAMVWATVKDAAGLWHSDRYRPLIGASANLIINIILVQFIGLYGIIISTIISYVFILIPWLIHNIFNLLYKRSPVEYIILLAKYIFITIICCFICAILSRPIDSCPVITPVLKLVAILFICLFISNMLQLLIYRKTPEFIYGSEQVFKLINRGKRNEKKL